MFVTFFRSHPFHADRSPIHKTTTLRLNDYLDAFSIAKNARAVFNCRTQCDQLRCLNGIRVLTNIWVMFGHTVIWSHREAFSKQSRLKIKLISLINDLN